MITPKWVIYSFALIVAFMAGFVISTPASFLVALIAVGVFTAIFVDHFPSPSEADDKETALTRVNR